MADQTTVLIDGRTALTGGGATVFKAVDDHLVPALRAMDVTVRRPTAGRRSALDSPALPLTLPGRQPDVVLALSEAAFIGAGGSEVTIMLARNWNCWTPASTLRRKYRSLVARVNAARADVIVTATTVFAGALQDRLGSSKRIEVLPFGVGTHFTPEGPARSGSYFLCVGDWYPWKNFEVAVESFAKIADELPESVLRIAGRQIHHDYLDNTLALARSLGVADRIEVLGAVEPIQLADLYRGAIATVATSELETFGHPYLESMASGTPLIGRSMDVTEELVGRHGMLLQGDVDAFAEAMLHVATSDTKQATAEALEHVSQYSWTRFSEGLRSLITEAVA